LCVAFVEIISSPLFVYFLETTNCRRRPPPDGCERLIEVKKAATEHWSVESFEPTYCHFLSTIINMRMTSFMALFKASPDIQFKVYIVSQVFPVIQSGA